MATSAHDLNIFQDPRINAFYTVYPTQTLSLGFYFPAATQEFSDDLLSKLILDFKTTQKYQEDTVVDDPGRPWYKPWLIKKKLYEKELAIKWFAKIITKLFVADAELMFIAVPPSTNKTDDGPTMLVAEIKTLSSSFRNGSKLLVRHTDKMAAHAGGDRSEESNIATLRITNPEQIRNKIIILIDDVIKSGSSMKVCRELLLNAGAAKVICLTIGRAPTLQIQDEQTLLVHLNILSDILQKMECDKIDKYSNSNKKTLKLTLEEIIKQNTVLFQTLLQKLKMLRTPLPILQSYSVINTPVKMELETATDDNRCSNIIPKRLKFG